MGLIRRPARRAGAVALVAAVALAGSVTGAGVSGRRPAAAAAVRRAAATRMFRITDPRIGEASGIARGMRSPDVYWVQNDSGNPAELYALDARTGAVRGVYSVPGASNVDWEDLAVAPDARGVASIWIADIGDNDANRSEVRIYRVDEPLVAGSSFSAQAGAVTTGRTSKPDEWRLRYPGGPRDAEALAVAPGGAMWIFDKVIFGYTQAFRVPVTADPRRVRAVQPVGRFATRDTGTSGGPGPVGRFTVTGAALNRAGTVLAVRTYTDAYVWSVRDGEVTAALRTAPVVTALPAQPQGEGIAVDGDRMVVDSEGTNVPVWSVPLPTVPTSPARTDSSAGRTTGPATGDRASPAASSDVASASPGRTAPPALFALGAVGVGVLLIAAGLILTRTRRRAH